mmetsp:Transcript_12085/g.41877  ORF Transcript_12085/g.41877 Transcript_12085/m.41877 type:complete len:768 (+) Transcript_12085:91-2394(+)|eukprot:CAMPEP_0183789568 /NCGR_PEP_ID=MMETSP0803_2-20130417/498_1 /TAXON_ID=195967 /ORGANISM="Crustomastix stigmata, Strain CCMP3273" /LENGTH=767 /DNA_ID=CAMNT_0026033741 /DNA_START=34 /DNA_END=2337 /DNA_ORIENTATION=-
MAVPPTFKCSFRRMRLCETIAPRRVHGNQLEKLGCSSRNYGYSAGARVCKLRSSINRELYTSKTPRHDVVSGRDSSHELVLQVGESEIVLETGVVGRQANSSVWAKEGNTVIYSTLCTDLSSKEREGPIPLSVSYQERFSAVGRTATGFQKRDGRMKDHEILMSRLIDRPLRPTICKGWQCETQLLSWVLSYDRTRLLDGLAITVAGATMALSEVPVESIVAGVHVSWLNGQPVVNPLCKEPSSTSPLELTIAGTESHIVMIEGRADFVSERDLLAALDVGLQEISNICRRISDWACEHGRSKRKDLITLPNTVVYEQVRQKYSRDIGSALRMPTKQQREECFDTIISSALENFCCDADYITSAIKLLRRQEMRRQLQKHAVRQDGRRPDEVRPIESKAGILPCTHGSSLFTRGETQALCTVTLGGAKDMQIADDISNSPDKRFNLQYFFPPSSVGETGRVGSPGRREIGHGSLAERALAPALPSSEEFPYTVRAESLITESDGSSSMATVCGCCIALLDAGVPLLSEVSGVAMGVLLPETDNDRVVILTDILGSEDDLGDIDLKVAGNESSISAIQLDVKVDDGISVELLANILECAKKGRSHIIAKMRECSPPPHFALSESVPRLASIKVQVDKVGAIIGKGGTGIRDIISMTGVNNILCNRDTGEVVITAPDDEALEAAVKLIHRLTDIPEVNKIYPEAAIVAVFDYGLLVEIAPGQTGLLHIRDIPNIVGGPEEYCKLQGGKVAVRVSDINSKGQIRLSVHEL